MKIVKASVVVSSGRNDNVTITTDLPSPYACDAGTDVPLIFHFDCMRFEGEDYVRKHFGITPEIICVSI